MTAGSHDQVRDYLRIRLSYEIDVLDVATGEEAIVVASSGAPDLLVLDLGLPDIDGLEVLRRVRAFSTMPVIVL
ncbi:MAG: response regulator, partial [Gemmatimonadaceae bacterium]|nr:response regulator [Gemmatimonadaceae bacterium]